MEQHMAPAARAQLAHQYFVRTQPLAENHGLGVGLLEQILHQNDQLVGLVTEVGFMVQQPGAVARRAHVLQGALQAALVAVGQVAGLAPARDDAHHDPAIFVVVHALLAGHRHQQGLVDPRGQLLQHFGLAPAQHDRRQRGADAVQVLVADHPPCIVQLLVRVQQPPGGARPVLIHQLHDCNQHFQAVLQRGAGQHDGIGRFDVPQCAGRDRVPVLDALRLVEDQQIRRPGPDQVGIAHLRPDRDTAASSAAWRCLGRPLSWGRAGPAPAGGVPRRAPGRRKSGRARRCAVHVRPRGPGR